MEIKDGLVLHVMTWVAADDIKYNTIGLFQTSDSNTSGQYIVWWTCNAYTLQEIYTCHAFDHPVWVPEGEPVCPAKFMTPTRKLHIGIMSQNLKKLSWWSSNFCDALHWIDSGQQYNK